MTGSRQKKQPIVASRCRTLSNSCPEHVRVFVRVQVSRMVSRYLVLVCDVSVREAGPRSSEWESKWANKSLRMRQYLNTLTAALIPVGRAEA